MNIVHNCLDKWSGTDVEGRTAIACEDEPGTVITLTYGELTRDVNRCAGALRRLGIAKGDRVALPPGPAAHARRPRAAQRSWLRRITWNRSARQRLLNNRAAIPRRSEPWRTD